MKLKCMIALFIISSFGFSWAAPSNSLKPEALGAKAFLEDLLAKRFSQDLSAIVQKDAFQVSAQLDLTEINKQKEIQAQQAEEPISGLTLGRLDPEELLKKFGGNETEAAKNFLNNYKIKTVEVAVGLSDGLGETVKADVEKWLKTRLTKEFGPAGKGTVGFIKMTEKPPEKPAPEKTLLDWLSQFQTLASQLALGLLAIFAVLLWKMGSKPISVNINTPSELPALNANLAGETKSENSGGAGKGGVVDAATAIEKQQNEEDILGLSRRLNELAPKVSKEMEAIARSWCQMGDSGKLRLACFAEAVGKEIGRLPIPVDAMGDITKLFSRMATIDLKEKKEALQKAYWDLLSVINLGVESLDQPFGYLGGLNVGVMKEVLMDQNPKMQTLVSLYMPNELRTQYVGSLNAEAKMELLKSAAQLNKIKTTELRTMDQAIKAKIQPSNEAGSVPLDMTLKKMVEALSPAEQITLLPKVQEAAMQDFKRQVPSLAFVNEWNDEKIKLLVTSAEADEIVAFLSLRPEMTERMIGLCPPLTAELVRDDLSRTNSLSETDRNQRLDSFAKRLESMVNLKEISLEEIFANTTEPTPITSAKVA